MNIYHPQDRMSAQATRKATAADLVELQAHNRALESLAAHVAAYLAKLPAPARKRLRIRAPKHSG